MDWIQETPPHWDSNKKRIVGGAEVFSISKSEGDLVEGDWWRVEEDGKVVGYGWMESTFGDAEILLAVDSEARGHGVGTFILDQLEKEAHKQGLNYLYNVVPKNHPDKETVSQWLQKRKFAPAGEDGETLKRSVATK